MSDVADAATPEMNALEENIARRGNNAYYYAHGHRNDAPARGAARHQKLRSRKGSNTKGSRRWDGDPSPMKLETTAPAAREKTRCAITRYSWLDEDTKIRIYVPIEDERFQQPTARTSTTQFYIPGKSENAPSRPHRDRVS